MSMDYYRGMLIQRPRMEAFRRRLHEVVSSESVVAEIGAGLGTYAFFASEAGAKRVWAIEGGAIVHVARELAAFNDREVEFLQGWYPYTAPPEQADVVVFEDFPARFLDPTSFRILKAVHGELLKPGGTLVPGGVRIGAVPVCSEPNWRVAGPLLGEGEEAYGLNWHPTRELITHLPIQMPIRPEDFRGEPLHGPRIPLDPMPQPSDLAFRGEWTFQEETTLHGVAYWFEMEVVPGEWLTNEPGKEPGSWGYLYLPLDQAWRIAPGEAFQISIAPETTESGGPGWLTWTAESGDRRFLGHEFRSVVADPKDIIAASDSWRPRLGVEGEFARRSYELADGSRTLGDIVQVLAAETGLDQIEVSKRVRDLLADHTVAPEA